MNEIVLTSATYIAATNSTRIAYAEETPDGIRDGYMVHTIYHDSDATALGRNEDVDAFIAAQNANLQQA